MCDLHDFDSKLAVINAFCIKFPAGSFADHSQEADARDCRSTSVLKLNSICLNEKSMNSIEAQHSSVKLSQLTETCGCDRTT